MIKGHETIDACFLPPSGQPSIREAEVHLWRVWLDKVKDPVSLTLCPEERVRADRFRLERDRLRFIAARGTLRNILSAYLGMRADAIAFSTGPQGKPFLKDKINRLEFNLSHSGDLMLLAVAVSHPVGVDVEQIRDDIDLLVLAKEYFRPEDVEQMLSLPPQEYRAAFFQLWTRTEACLKAAGVGMAEGLRIRHPEQWRVQNLTPAPGYAAALAVKSGADCKLAYWSWPS